MKINNVNSKNIDSIRDITPIIKNLNKNNDTFKLYNQYKLNDLSQKNKLAININKKRNNRTNSYTLKINKTESSKEKLRNKEIIKKNNELWKKFNPKIIKKNSSLKDLINNKT